jgi:uncharacterized C2H2 Zn-finger protein
MSLRKSTTFNARHHQAESPIEQARFMPRRSQTCTKTLEDLLPQEPNAACSHQDHVAKLLQDFDDKISGRKPVNGDGSILKEEEVLAVPSFMVNQAIVPDLMDIDQKGLAVDHQHASDSGLGSSVASSIGIVDPSNNKTTIPTVADLFKEHNTRHSTRTTQSISTSHSTVTRSASAIGAQYPRAEQFLSKEAERHIRKHIIKPILAEQALKDFHPLVEDIPRRIGAKFISNLRDLEKTLFFLAPVSDDILASIRAVAHALRDIKDFAPSPQSFLKFCETSIECLHTTVDYLSERDQRRDTDRPYTNNYFLDLVEQIRRYAEIMARTREKQASGQDLDEMDYSPYVTPVSPYPFGHAVSESLMCLSHPTLHKASTSPSSPRMLPDTYLLNDSDEEITIEGGLSKNGKPAELVRKKDGKVIPLSERSALNEGSPSSFKRPLTDDEMDDDDVFRSMARRRKSDKPGDVMHSCRVCEKEFKRPCDLTKHEKTHSRPWKCSEPKCKYYEQGWPTEKERDRHVNDKHNSAPQMYKCRFPPCTYASKRESNCKQHMEKAHGWTYVRSKSNGRTKKVGDSENHSPPELLTPFTPFLTTPSPAVNTLSSPESNFMASPSVPVNNFNFNNFGYTPGPSSSEDLFDFNNNLRRESISTTGSVMTFSSGSNFSPAQLMNSAFEEALAPDNLNYDQGLFDDSGLASNFGMPMQQPTPAMSVNHGCDNTFAGIPGTQHLSPTGQANMTLYTPQMDNAHFDEALGDEMGFGQDFTLFDNTAPNNMTMPAVSNWYPDMGTISGQFDQFNFPNSNGFDDVFGNQH